MKKNIILTLVVCMFVGLLTSCGSAPKREIYVVHIHGDWCMGCKSVDPVVHSLKDYFNKKRGVDYIVFDETNPSSVEQSEKLAHELGLDDLFENERHTGEVLFVDKKTKKTLGVFASVGNRDTYIQATERLLKGERINSFPKAPKHYELSKPGVDEVKKAKLLVIDIHHDKCGTCAITVPTFEKVAKQYKSNSDVSFLTFDLSNPVTIKETRELATKLDILDIYDHHKHTGEVIFVDLSTKEIKDSLVAETNVVRYNKIIDRILGS